MPLIPSHFEGKAFPMTVITPVTSRWRRVLAKLILFIFKHLPLGVVKQLAFIHFARWMLIPSKVLPRLGDGQPKEELDFDLYVFTTNFNGSWDQYIDAFGRIHAVSNGLNMLWYTSAGFPGPWPMRLFKRYIHYFEYPVHLYYNAYPGASVRDIDISLQVEANLQAFLEATEREMDDEVFAAQYRKFVNEVGPWLGKTGREGEQSKLTYRAVPMEVST